MNKLKLLLILLVSAAVGLAVSLFLIALSIEPTLSPLELLANMLTQGLPSDIPLFVPLSFFLFLSTVLASMVGVIYFLVLPEIRTYYGQDLDSVETGFQMVMKTLGPDEKKVVSILQQHGGTYLQKYITKDAGFSKLKTHRVVARLAERSIVYVVKRGNTNEVSLTKWLLEARNGTFQG
jgi:uncharacterized membrane protein